MSELIPVERIENKIFIIRGQKVMLDHDLAVLYEVSTKRLNEQVRRNIERFPADFMFQLSAAESTYLRSQIATLKTGRGEHRKYLPFAFTENGVAMLSSVLKSKRAIQVNIVIMRAFTRLRQIIASHKELAEKFSQLERQVKENKTNIQDIWEAIRRILIIEEKPKPRIGFIIDE